MKPLPRFILAALVFAGVVFGFRAMINSGFISIPGMGKSEVPVAAPLPELSDTPSAPGAVPAIPPPSAKVASVTGPTVTMQIMAWNSQMGLIYANGGAHTTEGSLMAQHGVNLSLTREDDCGKMQASLVAFAQALKSSPQPTTGAHFVAVMGDGTAAYLAGMNEELAKIGPEYTAEIIGSAGYSRGEDKFMGPAEWKATPKRALGAVIAGVLRDGDWNIVQKWAGDNGLKNNPDEKTWDADALNWVAVTDYLDAGQKYVTGYCEDRKVVSNGKLTGETKKVCVNGVTTWTPGDVNVAHQKGGLVSIVSTKEYRSQMPHAIIGIKKWNAANAKTVEGFLAAMFEAGDQVKAYPSALKKAAALSAEVYKEQDAAYWERYYQGVTEMDKTGLQVQLGGSSVNNLADNLQLYGLVPGSANVFAATYTVFGEIVKQQYPKLVSSYPKVETILNTSYIQHVASTTKSAPADMPKFAAGSTIKEQVSKKSWAVNFQTGSASFTSETEKTLNDLANGLLVADELGIEIHGHTDNTGDPTANKTLSEQRALAVRNWLMKKSAVNFPSDRFIAVDGKGQTEPVSTNSTEEGRAKNRRVVIVLGTTS
jgi:outer membrane protein OmpA-like peptidoglycan-associated protein